MRLKNLAVFSFFIFAITFLFSTNTVFADSTSGYAWSENTGWIDFSDVTVTDDALAGYAYSPNIGWISFNCSNTSSCETVDYKVSNTNGELSGYAWSENTGYIDFSQVIIDTGTGIFSDYAYSPNIGWISLNCINTSSCETVNYKVTTEWRPPVAEVPVVPPVIRSNGHPIPPAFVPPSTTPPTTPTTPETTTTPTTTPPSVTSIIGIETLQIYSRGEKVQSLQSMLNTLLSLNLKIDGIFGPKSREAVMIFQKNNNLKVDGIVGPITRSKLLNK